MATPKENATRILQTMRELDTEMNGYTLMAWTGLTIHQIEAATSLLLADGLIRVNGATRGQKLAESWFNRPKV